MDSGWPLGSARDERAPLDFARGDRELELRARQLAFPLALGGMWLLVNLPFAGALVRIFLSMWLHEIGHATAALLCGRAAFPLPWFTPVAEQRSWVVALAVAASLGTGLYLSARREQWGRLAALLGVLALQAAGTLALPFWRTDELVLFAGDAGGLVLGTVLLCLFYVGPESRLHQGWLRWGLLVIGAAAVADISRVWWRARADFAELPFGEMEGSVKTDPLRLVEDFRWTEAQLISRYLALVLACLAVLAAVYVWGWLSARKAAQ